jgi:sugar phosphate isomerase/epimerase
MHDRVSVSALCFLSPQFVSPTLDEVADNWRILRPHRVSFLGTLVADDPAAARKIVDDGGYAVETITHSPLAGPELSEMIDMAARLGARSIYGLTGGRGELTWEEAAESFSRAIGPYGEQGRSSGIAVAIENASSLYADMHLGTSLRDTVAVAESAGIGVVIDVFGCWAEGGLRESIARAVPRCAVVQVCDWVFGDRSLPARAVPGDGGIPLKRFIDWILGAGYEGAFDLELIGPRIEQEGRVEAARRAADNVSEILASLGA